MSHFYTEDDNWRIIRNGAEPQDGMTQMPLKGKMPYGLPSANACYSLREISQGAQSYQI